MNSTSPDPRQPRKPGAAPLRPRPAASPIARATEAKARERLRLIIGGVLVFILAGLVAIPLSKWGEERGYEKKFSPVREVYDTWHSHLLAGEWTAAYNLMTPRYRFYHTLDDFIKEFEPFATPTYAVQPDHEIGRFTNEAGIMPNVQVPLEKRLHLLFRYHQDKWQIKGRRFAEEDEAINQLQIFFNSRSAAQPPDPET